MRRGSSPSASARAPTSARGTWWRRRTAGRWSPPSCRRRSLPSPSRSRASIGAPTRWRWSPPSRRWGAVLRQPGGRPPVFPGSRGAAGGAVGGDLAKAGLALADLPGLKGRGERRGVPLRGGGEALLIDESYNANPASMAATLKTFGALRPAGRRIAVLGAMRELGTVSEDFHADLAGPVEAARVDYAILVGEEMAALAKALGQRVKMTHVESASAATEALEGELRDGDAILVKGSNSIGLAALVEALTGGPSAQLGTGTSR